MSYEDNEETHTAEEIQADITLSLSRLRSCCAHELSIIS